MFVVLWEFEVKPGCEERFERVYGAGGDWAAFFRRDAKYHGTRLARDASRARTYLTLDFWTTRAAYEAFREHNRAEYQEIDARCEAMTEREMKIGTFESVS